MLVRFCLRGRHPVSNSPTGVFQAAIDLRDEGKLEPYEEEWLERELNPMSYSIAPRIENVQFPWDIDAGIFQVCDGLHDFRNGHIFSRVIVLINNENTRMVGIGKMKKHEIFRILRDDC